MPARFLRSGISAVAALLVALVAVSASAAKLSGQMELCDGHMCPWFKAVVPVPKGWAEDESWSSRYKALVMFPRGNKSKSVPLMYLRAHPGDPALALDQYVKVAQERWLTRLKDSTISRLDDVKREGKPAFMVYLYKNPSQPDQGFELTAFSKDVDTAEKPQTFFFQAVLSSPSMKELDKAKPAFYALINRL
jgi:hypothetical protein